MKAGEHILNCTECHGHRATLRDVLYLCPTCGRFHKDGARVSLSDLGISEAAAERLRAKDEAEMVKTERAAEAAAERAARVALRRAERDAGAAHPWRERVK